MRIPPVLLLLAALTLSGCGNVRNLAAKSRAKKDQKQLEKLIAASAGEASSRLGEKALGEVVTVAAGQQFTLLKLRTGVVLPSGSELECRRAGKRTALLRMTPEKNRLFTIADLAEGEPLAGDSVYLAKGKPSPLLPPPGLGAGSGGAAVPAGAAAAAGAPASSAAAAPEPVDSLPLLPPPATDNDDFNPRNLPSLPGRILTPEDAMRER